VAKKIGRNMDFDETIIFSEVERPSGKAVKFEMDEKTLAVVTHPYQMITRGMDTDFQISYELRKYDLTFEQHQAIGNFLRSWVHQVRAEIAAKKEDISNEKVNWAKEGF
jgi:hypothetical protein